MPWLILAIFGLVAFVACSPTGAPTAAAPAADPTTSQPSAKVPDRPAAPALDGIRLTVDGQVLDLSGEVKVSREKVAGTDLVYIGKNPRPSALVGGNGVLLELQAAPGKDTSASISTADIAVVTFTYWKGVEFSYISMGAMPGRPVENLVVSQTAGRLSGSFESDVNGSLGKHRARIDFGVPAP